MIIGQKKIENLLYLVLWAILFAAPVLSMYIGGVDEHTGEYDWQGVWEAWKLLAMFAVTFALHNFLLAPCLVYRNKRGVYACRLLVLLTGFTAYQLYGQPHGPKPRGMHGEPTMGKPMKPRLVPDEPRGDKFMPPMFREPKHREPPRAFGGQDSVAFIIITLLLGLNVGAKYFFRTLDSQKRMKELERKSLNQQLEYLKYQINPHFFMNTLNNIHALVDIDAEQAKYTIEVLSKLMRYVLYEGNKTMAPLQKELDFMMHYIELMRIRYTDKVRVSVSFPQETSGVEIPSLLFINFIENAFKHGVSYARQSFIDVRMEVESGWVHFVCRNSRKPAAEDVTGGVGMKNVASRLRLIYGTNYTLSVVADEKEYKVELRIPDGSKIKNL